MWLDKHWFMLSEYCLANCQLSSSYSSSSLLRRLWQIVLVYIQAIRSFSCLMFIMTISFASSFLRISQVLMNN